VLTRFEVGETEKHNVTVELNLLSKEIKIEVDGEVVSKAWHPSPLAKQFEFDVGGSEPHHIRVVVGAFHPAELSVDGDQIPPQA
jgi:hypothetical protein